MSFSERNISSTHLDVRSMVSVGSMLLMTSNTGPAHEQIGTSPHISFAYYTRIF